MRFGLLVLLALSLAAAGCGGGAAGSDTAADVSDAAAPVDVPMAPDIAPDVPTAPDVAPDAPPDVQDDVPDDVPGAPPDPSFVFEARESAVVWDDTPVVEEVATFYRTTEVLPDLDVHALHHDGTTLWVGTADGLYGWDEESDRFERRSVTTSRTDVLSISGGGLAAPLVVSLADAVVILSAGGPPEVLPVEAGRVRAAVWSDGTVWVATDAGVGRFVGDPRAWEPVVADVDARDLVLRGPTGPPWVATSAGVLALDGAEPRTLDAAAGFLPDDDVRALVALGDGRVLAATATGLAILDDESATFVLPGTDAGQLPTDRPIALAAHGTSWAIGHEVGATVRTEDGTRSDHYVSGRWLMNDRVQAVAIDPDGRPWLGTAEGLTRVDHVPRTLGEKATHFEGFLDDHCWRMDGFVSSDAWFEDEWLAGEPGATSTRGDKDNDGLWTQMQVGAWALAAGATGDPAYCEQARRAIRTMLLQIDIPAVDFEQAGLGRGFVTRSLVRDDEGPLFDEKASRPNWHRVVDFPTATDGHDYYWKDDTSSDETTGHFFGYPLYFDLCADEAERAEIAERMGALAGYILEHDFRLVDLDGEQTTHGEWYPELLAIAVDGIPACMQAGYPAASCIGAASGHGWLNGIEILGHMLAAWHMTGEQRFLDAYERLVTEHRYAELVDFHEGLLTVTSPAVANHSDHELAILGYFTLIRYEPDDERRARWIRSALDVYDRERPERNALWAFLIASITSGDEADVETAVRTLHEIPLDLRKWRVDNAHRLDARRLPNDRHGDPQFDRVFPYDELRTIWWNGNLYGVSDGGNPREVQSPMFYLLPYWGLRYFGAIGAPRP